MVFFSEIFGKPKITLKELKIHLIEVERQRKKKLLEIRKLKRKQERILEKLKDARRLNDQIEVDYLWEEIKQFKLDAIVARREGKILNFEAITLKKYIHGIERLEKVGDNEAIKSMINRIKESGLDSKLSRAKINDQEYMDELTAILDNSGLKEELAENYEEEDPLKEEFLSEIDEIIKAEEEGKFTEADKMETQLKDKLQETEESSS